MVLPVSNIQEDISQRVDAASTIQEILAAHQRAKIASRDWHDGITMRRRLYDLDHYTGRPKQYEDRYSDPTPVSTVDMAVSVIMSGDIGFSAKGFSPSQSESDETGRVEKFLYGLLQINNEREEADLLYELALNLVRDGAAVIYTVWDRELEYGNTASINIPSPVDETGVINMPAFLEPPLRVQVIDPMKVNMIPGGPSRWSYICREEEMTVYDIETLYGVNVPKYGHLSYEQKQQTSGTLIDFWRLIKIGGKWVVQNAVEYEGLLIEPLRDMEGYDDLPFTIAFFKSVDRSKSKGWGHSILDPLVGTLEHLEKAINRRSRQILVYSSMPPVTRLQADRHVVTPSIIGTPIRLGPGEEFAFPTWPGNAPDVDKHIAFLQDRMRMSGFNESFYGLGGEGLSGYAISRLSDVNKLKIEVPLKNLELLFSLWARKTLRLLVNFAAGAVVRVYGRMRGEDFIEQVVGDEFANYIVKAHFRTKYPGDEVRKHAMATQVRGLLSDATLMENYLDVEQPGDERRKKLRELAQTHPVMQQYLMLTALLELAQEGDMAAVMAIQSLQGAMQQGGAPTESQPGAVQPEGGMMSSTGQPTPQEQGAPTSQEEQMLAGPLGGRPAGGML